MALKLLGRARPHVGRAEPHPAVFDAAPLNDEQKDAVRLSLGSDLIYLWGPPGTGKTTTLAHIVEAHYRAGRSVLVLSNTNIAVDTAAEKIAERLRGERNFHDALFLRWGIAVKPELIERFGDKVVFELVVERFAGSLHDELRSLKAELQKTAEALAGEKSLLARWDRLAEIRTALAALRRRRAEAEKHRAAAETAILRIEEKIASLRADEKEASALSLVDRAIRGLFPNLLRKRRESLERELLRERDKLSRASFVIGEIDAETEPLAAEESEILRKIPHSVEIAKKKIAELEQKSDSLSRKIRALDAELAGLREKIRQKARVVAATAHQAHFKSFPFERFDVVVIDEASMLIFPIVFLLASMAGCKVVIAGDFRQLPPIVHLPPRMGGDFLGMDAFRVAGVQKAVERGETPPSLAALRVQYRMDEPICRIVSEAFYPDLALVPHESVKSRPAPDPFPLGEGSLFLVNTSPLRPWASYPPYSSSRYNVLHAIVVRNMVESIAEAGFLPSPPDPNDALAVVSPFREQAELISAVLEESLGAGANGIASSVHSFQGNEKDTVILDLTLASGCAPGRFFTFDSRDSQGGRLFNVAFSRARRRLVVVADLDYMFSGRYPISPILLDILRRLRTEALSPPLRDVLLPSPSGLPLPSDVLGDIAIFGAGTFYPAFRDDLDSAAKSILIVSPYATESRLSSLMDRLVAAARRGVEVSIVSGNRFRALPPRQIETLLHHGIKVGLREKLHQKLAVIDGRIVWHGSLNILSHRGTEESMLRISSRAFAARVLKFMKTGAPAEIVEAAGPFASPLCPKCGFPMKMSVAPSKKKKKISFACPRCRFAMAAG
ncbi:MAG: hypothetical protein DRH12_15225 [Deltaproteobacteria bacterium]|nr:MAG: hypothetical protein DRH12_15225 [Deltaproteobacteria bacterium]